MIYINIYLFLIRCIISEAASHKVLVKLGFGRVGISANTVGDSGGFFKVYAFLKVKSLFVIKIINEIKLRY